MDGQDVTILTLPEDVILLIFQLLPQFEVLHNIRMTCKTWNHYSRDGILWRHIRAQDFVRETFRIKNFMGFLCDISHFVEELKIQMDQIDNLQEKQLFFPMLRSLKLYGYSNYNNDSLSWLSRKNDLEKSLKKITMIYPTLEVLHVNIPSTDFDITCCPIDLKELKVTFWYIEERRKPRRNIGEHFKALTHLGLRYCKLNNQTVLALLSKLECLESIDLTLTSYDNNIMDDEEIPDKPCSKRIQKFVLTHTHHMFFPRVFMYILLSAHERIRYIDISSISQKSPTSPRLYNIAEKCRQLVTLILGNYKE
ncbi:uncharacterized protein LOC127873343 isoform X2 [Dreissena polymorpha]|uniref:F-box domain-containing protein n=2 Tax=Dreissena polymorpha TaxID=45954 RepID=A0A9D4R4N7_DREPO|nr:uncharacterized protein LOC127873343 isoform X2 [Dreissena polymorpha]KAH3853832.1 hypothetical protein DPMN_096367 [Dreissena polymorpha]